MQAEQLLFCFEGAHWCTRNLSAIEQIDFWKGNCLNGAFHPANGCLAVNDLEMGCLAYVDVPMALEDSKAR